MNNGENSDNDDTGYSCWFLIYRIGWLLWWTAVIVGTIGFIFYGDEFTSSSNDTIFTIMLALQLGGCIILGFFKMLESGSEESVSMFDAIGWGITWGTGLFFGAMILSVFINFIIDSITNFLL